MEVAKKKKKRRRLGRKWRTNGLTIDREQYVYSISNNHIKVVFGETVLVKRENVKQMKNN